MEYTHRRERRLPPELLRKILNCFPSPYQTPLDEDAFLDLMAFSMVCYEWYNVARWLISDMVLKEHFPRLINSSGEKLRRFAALLSTSRTLSLGYTTHLTNSIITFDIDLQDRDALFKIAGLGAPMRLRIIVEYSERRSSPSLDRELFLSRLSQHCSHIPGLELYFPRKRGSNHVRPPSDSPHLANFVRSMHSTLSSININDEPDAMTRAALSSCPNVRVAAFRRCNPRSVWDMLCGSRNLREITLCRLFDPVGTGVEDDDSSELGGDDDDTTMALSGTEILFKRLSFVCMNFEVLEITSMRSVAEETSRLAMALEILVSCSRRLKRLSLSRVQYVDQRVIQAVAQHCQELESLEVHLTGVAIMWDEVTPSWPRLRNLNLSADRFGPEFVEQIVGPCDALQMLRLKSTSVWNPREALERRGFRLVNGQWER
ncbi:hypothetical protein BC936DRAFT_142390 [Jimgerdemannia flammicorona]|uniref:F-box domain-containing protein n=1 Tax=Jimgerdemannia flammicorona TaxID=994334 RepID=A0A433DFA7_9FUNG|nr:hypothetical protein BC936DRAFT_142390 [Jimgerdemannia flammicorona]